MTLAVVKEIPLFFVHAVAGDFGRCIGISILGSARRGGSQWKLTGLTVLGRVYLSSDFFPVYAPLRHVSCNHTSRHKLRLVTAHPKTEGACVRRAVYHTLLADSRGQSSLSSVSGAGRKTLFRCDAFLG